MKLQTSALKFSSTAILIGMCLVLTSVFAASAAEVTLTFATNSPPSGLKGDAERIFIEELEKASGGKIKVKPFWAESLLSIGELFQGVEDGIADMGFVNVAYYPGRLMRNSAVLLIDQGPISYEYKLKAFKRLYEEIPELKAEIEKFKQKIVYTYTISPIGWCFNKPVKQLADMKGLRVRTPSRWAQAVLADLGAIPVTLPMGDVYIALQTDSIHGVVTNMDSMHRAKFYEAAKHFIYTEQLWSPIAYFITINQRKWDQLPADLKQAFATAAANAEAIFSDKYDEWLTTMKNDIIQSGATFIDASQADYELWLQSPVHQKNEQVWLDAVGKADVKDGQELLKRMRSIVEEEIRKEKERR